MNKVISKKMSWLINTKLIIGFFFSLLFLLNSGYAQMVSQSDSASSSSDLVAVDSVDVGQYLGRWYQIARNPLPFEPLDCVCAQQTLSLNSQGEVEVYNSCNVGTPDGPIQEIRGKAFSQDPISNSRFTVDFNLPVLGQYWIISLASDYSWAVVSDPARRSLYILSKTPELDLQSYTNALAEGSRQISLDKLKVTQQKGCTYP